MIAENVVCHHKYSVRVLFFFYHRLVEVAIIDFCYQLLFCFNCVLIDYLLILGTTCMGQIVRIPENIYM